MVETEEQKSGQANLLAFKAEKSRMQDNDCRSLSLSQLDILSGDPNIRLRV